MPSFDEVLDPRAIIQALDRAIQEAAEEVGSPETQRLEQDRLGEELRKVDGQLAHLVAGLAATGGSATVLAAVNQGEQRKLELQAARDRSRPPCRPSRRSSWPSSRGSYATNWVTGITISCRPTRFRPADKC